MKKTVLPITLLLLLAFTSCKTTRAIPGNKKLPPPGISTMKKYGTKITPYEILNLSAEIMKDAGVFGAGKYEQFIDTINRPNYEKVFIIDSIRYTSSGYATDIKGHEEIPATYGEFIAKGGIGIPVYEAKEPNEFGVIFGRKADIAVRDGIIVKVNPLEYSDLYYIILGSETYDAISNASILFQCYEMVRTPYLENMRIELEGMILNSDSRAVILESMKKFKEENKNRYENEDEMMLGFINANESYLAALSESNKEAMKRIEQSKEMLDLIKECADTASGNCAKIFAEIALDIALITTNAAVRSLENSDQGVAGVILASIEAVALATARTAEYVARNVPKNSRINFQDLQNINAYNNYLFKKYNEKKSKNNKMEAEADKILYTIKKGGGL